jgi:hypothetical protein
VTRLSPDTTAAVQNAIAYGDRDWSPTVGIDEDAPKLAQLAIASDRKALEEQGYAIVEVGSSRIFEPVSSSDVHNGEQYYTIDSHVVEGYSATEQVGRGWKTAGNPMMGSVTVYREVTE